MVAILALDDVRVAALTAGIEAPVLEGLHGLPLADIAHQAAVGGSAAVGGLGGGESGKLILGFVAGVVELRVNVGGGLLVRDQNVADGDGVIVVAAAGVEEDGVVAVTLLGDGSVARYAVSGKCPGEHLARHAAVGVREVRIGAVAGAFLKAPALRVGGEDGLGLRLGFLHRSGLLRVGGVARKAGREGDVLDVHAAIGVGILVIGGLQVGGGVGQAVGIALLVGARERVAADAADKGLLGHVLAEHRGEILRAGRAAVGGIEVDHGEIALLGGVHLLGAVKAGSLGSVGDGNALLHVVQRGLQKVVVPGLTLGVLLLAGALAAVEAEGAAVVGEGVVNAAIVISHIVDAEVLAVDGHGALRADAGSLLGLVARLDAAGGEEHHAEQHKGDDDGGIDAGGAALLRLLLGLAGLAGIDVAGFVQLLTSLLFSRCTHGQWFPFKLLFVIKVYRAERRNGAAGWENLLRAEDAVARDFAPMRGAKPLRGSKPQADDSPCGKVLLRKTLERAFRRGRRRGVGEFTSCRKCGRPRHRDPGRCSRAR